MATELEPEPSVVILDSRTLCSSPERGEPAGHDGTKPRWDAKVHLAVDSLDHFVLSPRR